MRGHGHVLLPDRLARKFACQALLIGELARAGVRVEFVKGQRGDSPGDEPAGAVPGHVRRAGEAQLSAHRARRLGSVNVLSGAPFGYWYLRKSERAGGAYEITGHESALVAEMFRR